MAQSRTQSPVRRMLKLVALVAALAFGIKAIVLHPLYIQLASNVSYVDAWYTNILYYLIDGGLIDLAVFAVCYPATVYAIWREGLKKSRSVIAVFSLCTLVKYLLNYLMDVIVNSAIPDSEDLLADLLIILPMVLLELLQYAVTVAVIALAKRRYDARVSRATLESELTETDGPAPAYPFIKLVSVKNPLQLTAFVSALVLFLLREIDYHVYQLTLMKLFGSTDGWADMLLTLILDIVVGVLFYFAAILLLTRFHDREKTTE